MTNTNLNLNLCTEVDLAENYLLVSRCWNNYTLSLAHDMSFGKACKILQDVMAATGSAMLRKRCQELLDKLIYEQEEPDYLKDQDQA